MRARINSADAPQIGVSGLKQRTLDGDRRQLRGGPYAVRRLPKARTGSRKCVERRCVELSGEDLVGVLVAGDQDPQASRLVLGLADGLSRGELSGAISVPSMRRPSMVQVSPFLTKSRLEETLMRRSLRRVVVQSPAPAELPSRSTMPPGSTCPALTRSARARVSERSCPGWRPPPSDWSCLRGHRLASPGRRLRPSHPGSRR